MVSLSEILTVFKYLKYKPSSAICSRQIMLKLVKHPQFMFFKGLYWNFIQQVTGNNKSSVRHKS